MSKFCVNGYHLEDYFECSKCNSFTSLYTIYFNDLNVNGKKLTEYDYDKLQFLCLYCTPESDLDKLENIYGKWWELGNCSRCCVPRFNVHSKKGYIYKEYITNDQSDDEDEIKNEFKIVGYRCYLCDCYSKYYALIDKNNNIVTYNSTIDTDNVILICNNCTPRGWCTAERDEVTYINGYNDGTVKNEKIDDNIIRIRKIINLQNSTY